jgi:MFS family permease
MAVKSVVLPLHLADLSFSPIEIGLVIGIGNVVAMFFSPWAGVISGRVPKRMLLMVSSLSIGICLMLFSVVGDLVFALLVAIFLSISTTFLRLVLILRAADFDSRRASAIGLLNTVNSLATGLGSVLAGWIADKKGYGMAFPICALPLMVMSAVTVILGGKKLTGKEKPDDSQTNTPTMSMALQTPKRISLPMLFLMCDMGITVAWRTFLPIHLVNSLGWSVTLVGGLIAAQNILYSLCQPLSAYLADRIGYKPLLVVGLSTYGMLISLIPLTTNTLSIYGLILLTGIFASPIYPTSLALAADISSKNERGTAMGFMMASSNLAGALGPSIAGLIVSMAVVPSAGFAYCFIPALLVGLIGRFFLNRSVSQSDDLEVNE